MTTRLALFIVLAAFPLPCLHGQILPFDDAFEDDSSLSSWSPGISGGTRNVSDGDYIISHSDLASSFVPGSSDVDDISILTQLRILADEGDFVFAAVSARSPSSASYYGGIQTNGEISVGETFADRGFTIRDNLDIGINPLTTDVLLQFDVFGNKISLTAWAEGADKPSSPQLMFEDDTLSKGPFSVWMNTNTQSSVAYRWFQALPEPPSPFLIDDFTNENDDGWTHLDSIGLDEGGPGVFDAKSGAYNLKSTGLVPVGARHFVFSAWDDSADPLFEHGFLRGKIRVDAEGTIAYLAMRGSEDDGTYIFAGDTATNELSIQTPDNKWALPDIGFSVGEEWNIEAGVLGDRLTMKAWQVGDPEPTGPQVTVTDTRLSAGQFGVGANVSALPFPEPAFVDATFDDLHFKPANPAGDCNSDGLLNATDLSCVTTIVARDAVLDWLDTLPGDLDGDGEVAFADFLVLSANFNRDLPGYAEGNIDLTEGVAFADFLALSANFGKAPSVAAVPEPNAFTIVWFGCLGVVAFRIHREKTFRERETAHGR